MHTPILLGKLSGVAVADATFAVGMDRDSSRKPFLATPCGTLEQPLRITNRCGRDNYTCEVGVVTTRILVCRGSIPGVTNLTEWKLSLPLLPNYFVPGSKALPSWSLYFSVQRGEQANEQVKSIIL